MTKGKAKKGTKKKVKIEKVEIKDLAPKAAEELGCKMNAIADMFISQLKELTTEYGLNVDIKVLIEDIKPINH